MIGRVCGIVLLGFASALARGEVVVELVPDPPGPYLPGQQVTVHVWLRSEYVWDVEFEAIQFDFSQSDPALALVPPFTFDYSSLPPEYWPMYDEGSSDLPVPWTANYYEPGCHVFVPFPMDGRLHIGSTHVVVPSHSGIYRLDGLNATFPNPYWGLGGARLDVACGGPDGPWTAFEGEITGAAFDLVVEEPQIPAVSPTLAVVLGGLLIGAGVVVTKRRMVSGDA